MLVTFVGIEIFNFAPSAVRMSVETIYFFFFTVFFPFVLLDLSENFRNSLHRYSRRQKSVGRFWS